MNAQANDYTDDELRHAYQSVKGRSWPAFELAMTDPIRNRLIVHTAWRKAHRAQQRRSECDIPIPMPPARQRPPRDLFDAKAAAAGDLFDR